MPLSRPILTLTLKKYFKITVFLFCKGITTAFTFYNEEEYVQSLERLDELFARYAFKGLNPFASRHVKQTPHDANLMWASNRYIVVMKVLYIFKRFKTECMLKCHDINT